VTISNTFLPQAFKTSGLTTF